MTQTALEIKHKNNTNPYSATSQFAPNDFNVVKNDLNNTRDSLKEEKFISNYKFARIKYYTDIAAKGNNIKFLRGWIYRVLKEKILRIFCRRFA